MEIILQCGTKGLCLAQNVHKFLVRHKKFGPAQNILGPLEGRDISFSRLMVPLKMIFVYPNRKLRQNINVVYSALCVIYIRNNINICIMQLPILFSK